MLFKNYLKFIIFNYFMLANSKEIINSNEKFSEFKVKDNPNFVEIPLLNYHKFQQSEILLEHQQNVNGKYDNDVYESLNEKFPELEKVGSQNLYMQPSSKYCKCHQSTVFFKYDNIVGKDNSNESVKEVSIKDKEYFVLSQVTNFFILKNIFKGNNVLKLKPFKKGVINDANLYWKNLAKRSIPSNFNSKYQKYNHMLKFSEITAKHKMYRNYERFNKKFPEDFNYLPETFTSIDSEDFKERFKNYKISKDNLWLVKPRDLLQGKGIHFLKNIEGLKKHDIITKYISNPLLINNKKFDLRVYVLVTGHNPLKVYIYDECFARLATEDYDLDINNLDNIFKHLTNIHVGNLNKNRTSEVVMLFDEMKDYIEKTYSIDFSIIWKDIKDLVIKSLITMNQIEILEENKYNNLSSNSLFHLYGFDVMIDQNFKSWIIEVNDRPAITDKETKKMNYKEVVDILNILGIVPYSHITGMAMEGECSYKDSVDEAVQQSICEFTRPSGGFERIFPTKDNIDYYKQFFEMVTPNNQALWDEIKNNDFE